MLISSKANGAAAGALDFSALPVLPASVAGHIIAVAAAAFHSKPVRRKRLRSMAMIVGVEWSGARERASAVVHDDGLERRESQQRFEALLATVAAGLDAAEG